MILEGNERGYGAELAQHLLNPRDNDHVTVHAIEGFVADDLFGAFAEAEAISGATQCQKYLFSLSLNPPPSEQVDVDVFEKVISDVEVSLGLKGQPRAIVFHEKNGRSHAHAVWSRIDGRELKAIKLSHYKRKLFGLSKDLFRRHEWDMPAGFEKPEHCDPLNFTREEAGQAKRAKHDPQTLKAIFKQCWEVSDSRSAFAAALEDHGFVLARGDRRGFVAVDGTGKVWSLSRWCGVKTKDVRARLGSEDGLPSVEDAVQKARGLTRQAGEKVNIAFEAKREELKQRQRAERDALLKTQEQQRISDNADRQSRLPKGLRGLLARATGQYAKLLATFEEEARVRVQENRAAQQTLINRHLRERRALDQDMAWQQAMDTSLRPATSPHSKYQLVLPSDTLPFSKKDLLKSPELVLAHISEKKAAFSRTDVMRTLAKRIDDPAELTTATTRALKSSELIRVESDGEGKELFTTHDYRNAEQSLDQTSKEMSANSGFAVERPHIVKAMKAQNKEMYRAFGGRLSDEQCAALEHVLGDKQLSSVVGLAGAGKSTMLATALDAWDRQGTKVHGAALAGKAAEELENASGVASRTLATLELSWKNGYAPIAPGEALVIDEASMVSTRQMGMIAAKMHEIGAKLVLVGDPDQLQPIEAGTPFRRIVEDHGAAKLTEIHRQKEDWQKQASRDLASGDLVKAIERYRRHGAVIESGGRTEAIEALVETYVMDVASNGTGRSRLAFAHRRKDVHALNQGIREALWAEDSDEPDIVLCTETGDRPFAEGDRIVFTRNDKNIGVKNGMLGTVVSAQDSEVVVELDGETPRYVQFDLSEFNHFDHGYAVTIHKSQGATVDQSYVLTSRSMDEHFTYVAMTRHRDDMQVFVNAEDRPSWDVDQSYAYEALCTVKKRNRDGPSIG